jgi:hypothetical protein
MAPSKQELLAGLNILAAVAETIREAGEVPSGTIYAALLGKVSMEGYTSLLRTLKGAGLVEEKNHLLRWIGPNIQSGQEVVHA